jgi:hypothetical protein
LTLTGVSNEGIQIRSKIAQLAHVILVEDCLTLAHPGFRRPIIEGSVQPALRALKISKHVRHAPGLDGLGVKQVLDEA